MEKYPREFKRKREKRKEKERKEEKRKKKRKKMSLLGSFSPMLLEQNSVMHFPVTFTCSKSGGWF